MSMKSGNMKNVWLMSIYQLGDDRLTNLKILAPNILGRKVDNELIHTFCFISVKEEVGPISEI